jgi:urea transporter/murein DD-endopeptidase MepM/ murein hydrolase activator NlpD
MKEHLRAISTSYSEIFFINNIAIGIVLFIVTLINSNVAMAGILSVLSAYLFARFIHMDKQYLNSGFYTYNPLLVGLSIGYLFRITPFTILLIIIAGIFTFVLTIILYSIFSYYFKLPILSLPFVIVSSLAYLASSQYSNLFVTSLYPHFSSNLEYFVPLWLSGLLKSLGAILFMPDIISGTIFLLVIFFSSRIMFMLVVIGYYSGTLFNAAMIGSLPQVFSDINGFNFILIAVALGGIFFIPSLKSYILAIVAVLTSNILLASVKVFWSNFGIPVFTLPFNVVSLPFIYVLGLVSFPFVTKYIKKTPEESLDYYLTTQNRYQGSERTLTLPFAGKWMVWQAFDGKWTHQGSWRYAYDFVIIDEQNETYQNDGSQLNDYYAYRKPILSPIRGRVVKVIDNIIDNPIGEVDKTNNWGNFVIIRDERGFFVKLSHFMQNSIKVKEGDWVERSAMLGLCGNSGYSPQPHIHIQVQATEEIGSYTLPFSFVGFTVGGKFYSNALPVEQDVVEPTHRDKSLEIKFSYILDQKFNYDIYEDGQKTDQFSFIIRMAPDGTFYFDSGKGKLYFGKFEDTFYFYQLEGEDKYLKSIFSALPHIPLSFRENLQWRDYIPIGTITRGITKAIILFFSSFYHGLAKISGEYTFAKKNIIRGELSSNILNIRGTSEVVLDEYSGFKSVKYNNLELIRRPDEK